MVGGCGRWQGAPNILASNRVGGDVLHQFGGACRRTRPGGGAETSWGCFHAQALWGVLDTGMQKQLLGSGVQGRNCGQRYKIRIVGKYLKIEPQSSHL